MPSINKFSNQSIVLDNVLQYKTELEKQFKYISNPDSATKRITHLTKRQTRLEKELIKVKATQSEIPDLDKNIRLLKRGLSKSNTKIKNLENLSKLEQQASKAINIFRKIFLNIKLILTSAFLNYSTTDLPQFKTSNTSLREALSYLKKMQNQSEYLQEKRGHLDHLIRTTRAEKNQIGRLNIPVDTALQSAEHQIEIDIERQYKYTINDQRYADFGSVISKLKEICEDGIGRWVLLQLSNQTLPSLLKNIIQHQINAFYHQSPDNPQYIVQDISDSKNIHIKEKKGIFHIDLTVKHSLQNPTKEEYYQMNSSIHLELDKSGNIVKASLSVVPTL